MPPKLWPTITKQWVSAALLLSVAIMAQPPEQFPHRAHRHPLPGRLPGPEGRIRDGAAQAEIR